MRCVPPSVDRFLDLSIPYDMSNTNLIAHLAESYDASLVPALSAHLDETPPGAADSDLRRFLLVRVGCRWAWRFRDDAYGVDPMAAEREGRRALLEDLGRAIAAVESPTYRSWLESLPEDRACLQEIESLRANGAGGADRRS